MVVSSNLTTRMRKVKMIFRCSNTIEKENRRPRFVELVAAAKSLFVSVRHLISNSLSDIVNICSTLNQSSQCRCLYASTNMTSGCQNEKHRSLSQYNILHSPLYIVYIYNKFRDICVYPPLLHEKSFLNFCHSVYSARLQFLYTSYSCENRTR